MGMAIGGIAQASPRMCYGWVGNTSGAPEATVSQDLTVGGFSKNLLIEVVMSCTDRVSAYKITIVGASNYDIVSEAVVSSGTSRHFTALVKNGFQNVSTSTLVANGTQAIAIPLITAIRATVVPDAGYAGVAHIYGISVIELDNQP